MQIFSLILRSTNKTWNVGKTSSRKSVFQSYSSKIERLLRGFSSKRFQNMVYYSKPLFALPDYTCTELYLQSGVHTI